MSEAQIVSTNGHSVTNTPVTWAANIATISAGFYSTPAVPPPVTVTISPSAVTLSSGATQQFTAIVAGSTNSAVSWSIDPSLGAIDPATGFYTSPSGVVSTQIVTVTATSDADPTSAGMATVTLVPAAPSITSASSTMFTIGTPGTFTVTTTGFPTPSLSESGTLPNGLNFIDNHDGTGTLSGTPTTNAGSPFNITLTASNGVSPAATQVVTLTVNPGGSGATFVGFDTATQGNWQGKYGADGYSIANSLQSLPSYVTFSPQNDLLWTWASNTTDARALRLPNSSLGIASTWYNNPGFSYDVNITDGNTHQIALYALDWDSPGGVRSENVQIVDANNPSHILDTEILLSYTSGTYLVWNISGHVTINVTLVGGANAVISAVFFGAPAQTAPAITSANNATFAVGSPGTFSVAATGNPLPTLSETGTLPSGVMFNTATGVLGGTPATGSNGSYPVTFTASNGVSPNATQSFTLTVNAASAGGSGATFVGFDTATQGNWQGKYGADGYSIANYAQSLPSYAGLTPQNVLLWTWASSTSDARALKIPNSSFRIASTWYDRPSFSYDLNITDGNTHQIALYALDWDSPGGVRSETVQIVDANNPSHVLDTETLLSYTGGTYLVWNINGHVTINVTWTGGANAAISGVFFGVPPQTAPAITSANSAIFTIGSPATFSVTATGSPAPTLNETGTLPGGVTFNTTTGALGGTPAAGTNGSYPLTFTASNGVSPDATQSFTLTVNQTGQAPTIGSSQSATFTIGSPGTLTVTATGSPSPTLSESGALPNGVTFKTATGVLSGTPAAGTNGSYTVTFTASNGVSPNAMQSFTLTVNPGSASGSGATFVGSDITTQGNWQGKYGTEGYSIANYAQNLPGYATFSPQNALLWTWASSTTDVRALRIPNSSLGIASTWYNNPSFTYDLNITDGNTHQVALYALDWDSPGGVRSETVQIVDASNPSHVLDTETLLSYTGGTYLVWNINGHVTINVIRTAGANAVISGVFFGVPPQTAPAIASPSSATFAVGSPGSFTVTATGNPTPTLSESGALPNGVTFKTSTGILSGTPTAGTNGSHSLTFTASNGINPSATQNFTLTVNQASAGPTATFVGQDSATQGNWQGRYGSDGYSIANASQNLPSYASFAPQNALLYTWAASTSDVRALTLPDNSLGIASTWYQAPSFYFDVDLTDSNTHQVAVYLLDWDSRARSETVQITDTIGTTLDRQSVTNFAGGTWLVWNVSGHVQIRFTVTAGANAVVSGIFFDPPQSFCAARGVPAGLITFGDSITAGGGVADPSTQDYVALMAPTFGGTVTNNGVSGYEAVDMTVLRVYPDVRRSSSTPATTILIGTNDANSSGTGTDVEAIFNRSLNASIAWLAIPHAYMVYGQDPGCVQTSGSWSADNAIVSGVGIESITNGSVLTCTVSTNSSGVVYVAYRAFNSNGGTMSVQIDGNTPGNDAILTATGPGGQAIVTQYGTTSSIFLARYAGLSSGSHTLVFTVTSATNDNNINSLMWVGTPYPVTPAYARVYVGGVIPQEDDAKSAATAAYNMDVANDVAQFMSDGLPVDFVDVRNWINSTDDFDGGSVLSPPITGLSSCTASTINPLHPGTCGHAHLAQAFEYYRNLDVSCQPSSSANTAMSNEGIQ